MKKSLIYIVVILGLTILSLLISSWAKRQPQAQPQNILESVNETTVFLGSESMWHDIQIELKDVQGLWGGRNIFISGSGRAIVQVVNPEPEKGLGLFEKRYALSLNDSEVKKLINAFVENDFVTIDIKDRPGVPDEARPEIILVNPKGEYCKIAKWANDQNERFDQIYQQILLIQNQTEDLSPVLESKWNWENFMPEGFYKDK